MKRLAPSWHPAEWVIAALFVVTLVAACRGCLQ